MEPNFWQWIGRVVKPLLQGCTFRNTCCKGVYGPRMKSFAIATNRKKRWQGIKQDIIVLIEENVTYAMSAIVRTSRLPCTWTKIITLVHLEIAFSTPRYLTIGRYYLFLHKQLIHLNGSIGFTLQLSCHFLCLNGRNPISLLLVL